MTSNHAPVLLEQAVEALAIDRGSRAAGTYVDATFGRGGHARSILSRLGPHGRLIAFDRDADAIASARSLQDSRFTAVQTRFSALEQTLRSLAVQSIDGILLDLGMSSPQLDNSERGFSFRTDAPLDMRMDRSGGETAAEWLARATEGQIKEVVKNYGQERFAAQIAKAIVAARTRRPVTRTRELADIVGAAVRTREPGQHPATRTFQALRIHINQELEELSLVLPQARSMLTAGGRLAVISFHSLEDRIVKNFIRDSAHPQSVPERLALRASEMPQASMRAVGKPQRATPAEIHVNPRARSAVLRVAEKLH